MSMAMGKTPRYIVKLNKQNGELMHNILLFV